MANPAEKEVRRKSVDDVKVNLLRPSLTSYFAVQIPVPNGKVKSNLDEGAKLSPAKLAEAVQGDQDGEQPA